MLVLRAPQFPLPCTSTSCIYSCHHACRSSSPTCCPCLPRRILTLDSPHLWRLRSSLTARACTGMLGGAQEAASHMQLQHSVMTPQVMVSALGVTSYCTFPDFPCW